MRTLTSFGPDGYRLYGERFLETYTAHWDVPIDVYYETEKPPPFRHKLVRYKSLFKTEGCSEFLRGCQFPAMRGDLWGEGKRNYRYDIFKFCRKSFAQVDAASHQGDWLFWLDADVEWTSAIDLEECTHDGFMSYLGRPEWHSCASFVGWNLRHEASGEFWRRYWMLYMTGTVFCLPEWHDSFILDWLRMQTGVPAKNLAEGLPLKGPANVFDEVFGQHAHHKKGNLKYGSVASVGQQHPDRRGRIWDGEHNECV